MKQQALEAFRETLAVFQEQIGIGEKGQKLAAPHELLRYVDYLMFHSQIICDIIVQCTIKCAEKSRLTGARMYDYKVHFKVAFIMCIIIVK